MCATTANTKRFYRKGLLNLKSSSPLELYLATPPRINARTQQARPAAIVLTLPVATPAAATKNKTKANTIRIKVTGAILILS